MNQPTVSGTFGPGYQASQGSGDAYKAIVWAGTSSSGTANVLKRLEVTESGNAEGKQAWMWWQRLGLRDARLTTQLLEHGTCPLKFQTPTRRPLFQRVQVRIQTLGVHATSIEGHATNALLR